MPAFDHAGLSPSEAAEYLGISRTTLDLKKRRGQLPAGLAVKISENRIVYVRSLLERWLELGCPRAWPPGEPRGAA